MIFDVVNLCFYYIFLNEAVNSLFYDNGFPVDNIQAFSKHEP